MIVRLFFTLLCIHHLLWGQKIYVPKNNYNLYEPIEIVMELPVLLPKIPELPTMEGLDFIGNSQNFKKVNQKNVYSYYFLYKAKKEGVINIPPFQVQWLNQQLSFSGKQIKIYNESIFQYNKKPEEWKLQPNDIILELQFNKNQAYVGEQIQQKVFLYIKDNLTNKVYFEPQAVQNLLTHIKNTQFWEENLDTIPFQNVSTEYRNGSKYQKFLLNFSCLYAFFPGTIHYEALPLKIKKRKYLQTDIPLNPFEEISIYSNPIELNILKVPQDNLITGDFSIDYQKIPQKILLGEKIDFKYSITGNGNLNTLNIDEIKVNKSCEIFENQRNIKKFFFNGILYHSLEVSYQILPKDTGFYRISEIKIPFYNTKIQKIDFLKVPSFSFEVESHKKEKEKVSNLNYSQKPLNSMKYSGWNFWGLSFFLSIVFLYLWFIYKHFFK